MNNREYLTSSQMKILKKKVEDIHASYSHKARGDIGTQKSTKQAFKIALSKFGNAISTGGGLASEFRGGAIELKEELLAQKQKADKNKAKLKAKVKQAQDFVESAPDKIGQGINKLKQAMQNVANTEEMQASMSDILDTRMVEAIQDSGIGEGLAEVAQEIGKSEVKKKLKKAGQKIQGTAQNILPQSNLLKESLSSKYFKHFNQVLNQLDTGPFESSDLKTKNKAFKDKKVDNVVKQMSATVERIKIEKHKSEQGKPSCFAMISKDLTYLIHDAEKLKAKLSSNLEDGQVRQLSAELNEVITTLRQLMK